MTAMAPLSLRLKLDSAGAKAGLKVGDVVTELNGKKVTRCRSVADGDRRDDARNEVDLAVMRDGKTISVPVTLESMDAGDRDHKVAENTGDKPRWGIGIADMTPEVREQLNAPDTLHGAVIERVQPGSPADDARLAAGTGNRGRQSPRDQGRCRCAEGADQHSQRSGCHGADLDERWQHLSRSPFFERGLNPK